MKRVVKRKKHELENADNSNVTGMEGEKQVKKKKVLVVKRRTKKKSGKKVKKKFIISSNPGEPIVAKKKKQRVRRKKKRLAKRSPKSQSKKRKLGEVNNSESEKTTSSDLSFSFNSIEQDQTKRRKKLYTQPDIQLSQLTLPKKYNDLEHLFTTLDVVCACFISHGNICAFETVYSSVEKMTNKSFNIRHLAQMKTVYPEAYKFELQSYHNYISEKQEYRLLISPVNKDFGVGGTKFGDKKVIFKKRKEIFHHNLLQIARKHLENGNCLELPDVEQAFLPQAPSNSDDIDMNDLGQTGNDTTMEAPQRKGHPNGVRVQYGIRPPSPVPNRQVTSRLDRMLLKKRNLNKSLFPVDKQERPDEEEEEDISEGKTSTRMEIRKSIKSRAVDKSLIHVVSDKVLQNVRRREEEELVAKETNAHEKQKRQLVLSTLPAFCEMIRSFYLPNGIHCMKMDEIVAKLISSYYEGYAQTMSRVDVMERLELLCKFVPEWVTVLDFDDGDQFLKISKDTPYNACRAKLKDRIIQEIDGNDCSQMECN